MVRYNKKYWSPSNIDRTTIKFLVKGEGKVEYISKNGAVGKCYYGVFKGNNYEKI